MPTQLKASTEKSPYSEEDHLWAKVISEASFIESDGVWEVIDRLKTQFTILKKVAEELTINKDTDGSN